MTVCKVVMSSCSTVGSIDVMMEPCCEAGLSATRSCMLVKISANGFTYNPEEDSESVELYSFSRPYNPTSSVEVPLYPTNPSTCAANVPAGYSRQLSSETM